MRMNEKKVPGIEEEMSEILAEVENNETKMLPEEKSVTWVVNGYEAMDEEMTSVAQKKSHTAKKRTPAGKKAVFYVTVAVLVIAFAVSAFLVADYIMEGRKEAQMYEQLAQQATADVQEQQTQPTEAVTVPPETTEETTAPTEPTVPEILPEMKAYVEANEDTIGYIEIPDTKLNYPIVQTPEDPNFYIDHNFEKQASQRGAIYAWGSADFVTPSDNTTLFGHNMKDGSMFASLMAYQNKEHWEKNSLINVYTLNERHTYKIFAVFKCSANLDDPTYFSYHNFTDAASKEEYEAFVNTCKEKSFYDTGITPVYINETTRDKIICLSTCEYTLDNGRFVVCAVRWT